MNSAQIPPSPEGLEYRHYQVEGAHHMYNRASALIADQPGLGKTIQVCGLFNLFEAESTLPALIVCPASLTINWLLELKKWLTINRMVGIADGGGVPSSEIVIINYDLLRIPRIFAALNSRVWGIIVADEAHRIKNPESQRTGALLALRSVRRYALTGTPMPNSPVELWALLYWLDPIRCPSWSYFTTRYCGAFLETIHYKDRRGVARVKKVWNYKGSFNMPELHQVLLDFGMIRRLKKDVLPELPPKTRQIIELPGGVVDNLINREWSLGGQDYESKVLRLSEGDPVGIEDFSSARKELALAKVKPVVEILEDVLLNEPKIIVFAHHGEVIAQLAEALAPYGVATIQGADSVMYRQDAKHAFQTDPGIRVFIGSIHAAGEGLTLTAAGYVGCVELDPVPAIMEQAEDRAHRMGTTFKNILIHHFVFNGSLDARIARGLLRKQAVIDKTVDGKL